MRWLKLLDRYSLVKRPVLRVVNPRVGTSIVPLDLTDGDIFLQYLTNKLHALHFEGSENQLRKLIFKLSEERRFSVQKIRTSVGRGSERLVLIHLRFPDEAELRRIIKLT